MATRRIADGDPPDALTGRMFYSGILGIEQPFGMVPGRVRFDGHRAHIVNGDFVVVRASSTAPNDDIL